MTSPVANQGDRPPKRAKFDYSEAFIVLAGKEQTSFAVHKNIVCQSSEFFDAAANEVKDEGKAEASKTITLPGIASEMFDVYLGWLYSGRVDVKNEGDTSYKAITDASKMGKIQRHFIDAYVVGTDLEDRAFRNAAVDELKRTIKERGKLISSANISHLWEHVSHNSKMTQMIVDYCITDYKFDDFEVEVVKYPPGFVMEIAKSCVREKEMGVVSRKPRNRSRCYYHEHLHETDKCK